MPVGRVKTSDAVVLGRPHARGLRARNDFYCSISEQGERGCPALCGPRARRGSLHTLRYVIDMNEVNLRSL